MSFFVCESRYGRHKKNIEKTSGTGGTPSSGNKDEPSLIDFGSNDSSGAHLASKMGALNVGGTGGATAAKPSSGAIPKTSSSHAKKEPDDFDMFAQSRGTTYEKSKTRYNSKIFSANSINETDLT